jgi:hypothetical protein
MAEKACGRTGPSKALRGDWAGRSVYVLECVVCDVIRHGRRMWRGMGERAEIDKREGIRT